MAFKDSGVLEGVSWTPIKLEEINPGLKEVDLEAMIRCSARPMFNERFPGVEPVTTFGDWHILPEQDAYVDEFGNAFETQPERWARHFTMRRP